MTWVSLSNSYVLSMMSKKNNGTFEVVKVLTMVLDVVSSSREGLIVFSVFVVCLRVLSSFANFISARKSIYVISMSASIRKRGLII